MCFGSKDTTPFLFPTIDGALSVVTENDFEGF